MVNILFDCPNEAEFLPELREFIPRTARVTVLALSYYDDYIFDAASWRHHYGEGGRGYDEILATFTPFGISPDRIEFVDYFSDTKSSATEKIRSADILYFTGGLPDRMMERIIDMDILDALKLHTGTVMGYSAGAVIQLGEYHLSPDSDYSEFGYYRGLGYLDGLYLEVHYEGRATQDESIERVLRERDCPLFVFPTAKGGIVVTEDGTRAIGDVKLYMG